MKILTVIGARPQIIKAAALSRAVRQHPEWDLQESILHTGQHYDSNMSQVFFDELDIPQPDYNLGVGSASHGQQTARMTEGIEQVLQQDKYQGLVLYGDTNSTLAGAIAASKLHIPVFHIEAGLRSFNMSMPEEINRIVCDQLSNICFAPTQTAIDNLMHEGFGDSKATFANGRQRQICNSGDVMYDNSMHFSQQAAKRCDILQRLHLAHEGYLLATIHRPANTDDATRLSNIFSTLIEIADSKHLDIVLPLHPRTKKMMQSQLSQPLLHEIQSNTLIHIIPPASFFEIIELERHALLVMTDSGGVQKESFFFERPSIILRQETEWVEIVDHGAGVIADADPQRILDAFHAISTRKITFPPLFGDAHAAEKIAKSISNYLQQ